MIYMDSNPSKMIIKIMIIKILVKKTLIYKVKIKMNIHKKKLQTIKAKMH